MENLELHKALESFEKAIDSFPASQNVTTFYSIEKLLSFREHEIMSNFLGEDQLKKANRLIYKLQDAIAICKTGNLEEGISLFQSVKKNIVGLSENATNYVNLYYLSGMAYYHYRSGNLKDALDFTWEEISKTEHLEAKGAITLHIRRAGHILNVVKILNSCKRIDETIRLSLGNTLYALNGNTDFMPVGHWNHTLLDFIPYIRQRFFDICFLNTVEIIVENQKKINYNDDYFYKHFYSQIPDFEVTNNNLAMIYNWLYIQRLNREEHKKDYVLNAIEFCQVNFDYTFDVLKLSLLPKIIEILKSSSLKMDFKEIVISKINNYVINKLQSKNKLKEKVCNLILE